MSAWYERSEQIDAIAPSIVKALGELNEVPRKRTANTGSYSYSYADLGDAIGMTREILAANDLALTQSAEVLEDEVVIWTTLLHASGQYLTYAPTRLPAGKTAQNTGSAITYARRYSLMAALGLATEDDDGASASPRGEGRSKPAAKKQFRAPESPRTPEEEEIRSILASIPAEAAARIRGEFRAVFGGGLTDLPNDRHPEAFEWVVGAVSEWDNAQKDSEG